MHPRPSSSPFFLRYSASTGSICVYGFNDGLSSLAERIITALDPFNDNPLCILNDPLLQRRFPQIMERRLRSKRNFTKVNRFTNTVGWWGKVELWYRFQRKGASSLSPPPVHSLSHTHIRSHTLVVVYTPSHTHRPHNMPYTPSRGRWTLL